jgi:hypothetical protein
MAHCPRYLQAVAACQLTPRPAHPLEMTTKSRQRIYGASIRASAQRAKEARKEADRLAGEAWNMRPPGFTGPAQMRSYSACNIPEPQASRISGGTVIMPTPSQRSPPPEPVLSQWSA